MADTIHTTIASVLRVAFPQHPHPPTRRMYRPTVDHIIAEPGSNVVRFGTRPVPPPAVSLDDRILAMLRELDRRLPPALNPSAAAALDRQRGTRWPGGAA